MKRWRLEWCSPPVYDDWQDVGAYWTFWGARRAMARRVVRLRYSPWYRIVDATDDQVVLEVRRVRVRRDPRATSTVLEWCPTCGGEPSE